MSDQTKELQASRDSAINVTELLSRVENDWDLLRELAGIFVEDFPRYQAALRQAVQDRNPERIAESAHALKGMLANLAATGASKAASDVEQLGKQGNLEAVPTACAKFEKETQNLLAEVEGLMAGAGK